jgi:hypothetical protein
VSILKIEYWELDEGIVGIDVEGGEFSGTLAHQDGLWRWDLFEGDDTQAFASGSALTEALAKDDLHGACIDRIVATIF